MNRGTTLDLEASMPGHVRVGDYLVALDGAEPRVMVLCRRNPNGPSHGGEYLRTIKPQSANWRKAVKDARATVVGSFQSGTSRRTRP